MGCGAPRAAEKPAAPAQITIVVAEAGPQGVSLVAIDERGDRQFALTRHPGEIVRDMDPAISPDGAWVVFESSRGRSFDQTSLWIAPLAPDAEPVRLTDGKAIDRSPVWTRDGRAIVFASTRDGDFDLYRVAIARGRATGAIEKLTNGPGHEVTPTVAADGTIIYSAVKALGHETRSPTSCAAPAESHLEARLPDGTIKRVTAGPADTSPALSPDDRTIAFARPVEHNGVPDSELWTMPRDADFATRLVAVPMTNEGGPVWSSDGRFLFATSVVFGSSCNALFSSVIVVDTRERPHKARLLQDRLGVIARLTPAIRGRLDAAVLASDPEYLPELARIMAAAAAQKKSP